MVLVRATKTTNTTIIYHMYIFIYFAEDAPYDRFASKTEAHQTLNVNHTSFGFVLLRLIAVCC